MKKLCYVLFVGILILSCKNKPEESELTLIRGEFILIDEAAVIKGKDFIYGVQITDLTKELAEKTAPLQREQYDMVPVVIKGLIKPNSQDGWEEVVEIKEIIGVSAPTSELPTKIKSSETETDTEAENENLKTKQ